MDSIGVKDAGAGVVSLADRGGSVMAKVVEGAVVVVLVVVVVVVVEVVEVVVEEVVVVVEAADKE